MRSLYPDKDEGDPTVKKVFNDSLSINGHKFTFNFVVRETPLDLYGDVVASVSISNLTTTSTWSSPLE